MMEITRESPPSVLATRYLPGSVGRSFFLQQQVGDLDLPVLCSHVQRSEALLETRRTKRHEASRCTAAEEHTRESTHSCSSTPRVFKLLEVTAGS